MENWDLLVSSDEQLQNVWGFYGKMFIVIKKNLVTKINKNITWYLSREEKWKIF